MSAVNRVDNASPVLAINQPTNQSVNGIISHKEPKPIISINQ